MAPWPYLVHPPIPHPLRRNCASSRLWVLQKNRKSSRIISPIRGSENQIRVITITKLIPRWHMQRSHFKTQFICVQCSHFSFFCEYFPSTRIWNSTILLLTVRYHKHNWCSSSWTNPILYHYCWWFRSVKHLWQCYRFYSIPWYMAIAILFTEIELSLCHIYMDIQRNSNDLLAQNVRKCARHSIWKQ